jgi:hypothetical protein
MEAASKYQLTANKSFPNSKPDGFRIIRKSGSTFAEVANPEKLAAPRQVDWLGMAGRICATDDVAIPGRWL